MTPYSLAGGPALDQERLHSKAIPTARPQQLPEQKTEHTGSQVTKPNSQRHSKPSCRKSGLTQTVRI